MMAEHEVKIVNDLLRKYQPETCLEWGSGNSTIYFPKEHEFIKQWVSVEHAGQYNIYLKAKVNLKKVILLWTPNNQWYLDCVKHQGKKYDFVLIDGIHREECLNIAHQITKEGGIILLHDTGRKEYEKFISKYLNREILCEGDKPQKDGGFAHRGLTLFQA